MRLVIRLALVCSLLATAAWAQKVQVSADYLYQGANHVPGASDWFGVNGGRADVSLGNWRSLGIAAEFSGAHTSNLASGQGLTMFTYMAGPRRSLPLGRLEKRKLSAFGQVLLGGVHASDGVFPGGSAIKNSADAFAMSAGGGLEAKLNQRFSLRLIQADYLYARLPNFNDDYQSSFRLGAGAVFRLR